jgi:acyl-coenzyme A synthetase/AMP-(fatty) acid ligase
VEEAVLAGGEALEAVAVGVADERLGQAIVVMLAGDAEGESTLRARLRTALPSFMQPGVYLWRDDLPRNANGKLDRSAIANEAKACSPAEAEVPTGPPPSRGNKGGQS